MFCRKCGTDNADGAPSCISCGEPLANPFEPTAVGGSNAGAGGKPENYLIQSILATLCCCLPFGIVAIIYAAQVDSKWNAGDQQGAINAAANAKKWFWIAFGIGIVVNIIGVVAQLLLAGAGVAAQNAGQGGGF